MNARLELIEANRGLSAAGLVLLGLSLLVLLPAGAVAAEASEGVGTRWPERVAEIDADLRAGRWEEAHAAARTLGEEMMHVLSFQEGTDYALGMTAVFRALAAAGQNRFDEALWDWYVAQNLWPEERRDEIADLSVFGQAGEFLSRHAPREAGEARREGRRDGKRIYSLEEGLKPPVRRKGDPPVYPEVLRGQAQEGKVVVEAIVDEDGRLREPVVVQATGEPPLIFASLEALRGWEYEPARKNGEAVPAFQSFQFVFEIEENEE